MEKGYDVFGKAYGVMNRNDLHALESIDHKLMQEMILLDNASFEHLYSVQPQAADMRSHELYPFAVQFRQGDDRQTIENILRYCSDIALHYDVPFEQMCFGGTEKEILNRGTDWCADMARVGAVLLMCNGIPARIVHLVNPAKAYNGHVVVEAFYEGKYGICDFIYGYYFHEDKPLDAYELMHNKQYLDGYPEDYAALYSAVAISEYDPMGDNCYKVSGPNQYYINLINSNHNGKWIMDEDKTETNQRCVF